MKKKLALIGIMAIILLLALMAYRASYKSVTLNIASNNSTSTTQTDPAPRIITTKPDPLDENFIPATEIIEITFNRSIENVGEFKVRIEPQIDYKIELTNERKTARIIPVKPYQLGTSYTLFIGTETKFDGIGRWGEEKVFHFRTINYRGV